MDYAEEIAKEQATISALRQQIRNISLPRRTIAYQFQNMRGGNRNMAQRRVITQREKVKLNQSIASSNRRIITLREALLGLGE